ncbi:ROK family protein [Bacillus sp. AFS031507]|uniref:ROK family protein n=1 Tax=Bacillus sp. AFS031507 TaxID=2033496 RepID=UPI000BFC331C|nr:ROK family protein [Bacillus sp. AFS031507]PGY06653.1 glucose kinase [Bacillus sp. AFS031507]
MEKYLLGIDLGGTNLRIAVVTLEGQIIEELHVTTESDRGPHYVINQMIQLCEGILQKRNIEAIGIGSPGPLDLRQGLILSPNNLPGWDRIPLVEMLEKALQKKVVLDNDANAAALAEAMIGAGKGKESVFYITVSTGIGGGFVYRNQLIQGAHFCAGEVGNMIIDRDGPPHPALNIGSLETLASGTAVKRQGKEKLGITGHAGEVFAMAMQGEKEAVVIVEQMVATLAKGIANVVHTVDPHIIVLGGGVMQSKEYLMPLLLEKVNDYLYPQLRNKVQIECASLGTKAGVIGAALLTQQTWLQ